MQSRLTLVPSKTMCRFALAALSVAAWGLADSASGSEDIERNACFADLNDDGEVGPADLAALLGDYGPCHCFMDFNADHIIGEKDREMLFEQWGSDACDGLAVEEPCMDLDGDGSVGPDDLADLLGAFGACYCSSDFNQDGTVDRLDEFILMSQFGSVHCTGPGYSSGCGADLNEDGVVDDADLSEVIGQFGPCRGCAEDLSGDGMVNERDVLIIKGFWGECTPPAGMVRVPGGTFEMGCHVGPCATADEVPAHIVNLDSFYMDVYEVTNRQFAEFLNAAHADGQIKAVSGVVRKAGETTSYCRTASGSLEGIEWDGSTFTVTPGMEDHPMAAVSWMGAAAYCNYRSVRDGRQPCYDLDTGSCDLASDGYRLPTEAEWEYAARGGLHDPYVRYPWGNLFDGNNNANYARSGDPFEGFQPQTTPVGYYDGAQEPPGEDTVNGYGLYDMAGNVREWCNDRYDAEYYSDIPTDNPQGPESGTGRLVRGGSWSSVANSLRCAHRASAAPDSLGTSNGFRVVAGTALP